MNNLCENDYVFAGPSVIGTNSPTLPSSAPTPLSPQGSSKLQSSNNKLSFRLKVN